MRRYRLLIAASACAVAVLSSAPAWAEMTPAPPGQASGVAVQVGSLAGVSGTGATADPSGSSAQASAISVGGQPVANLGGTQKGDGQTGGALVDTGASLPARVEVAPWQASAASAPDSRSSQASAAALRAEVPKVVRAGVLTSESQASHRTEKSTGRAASNGADVTVLDTTHVTVLHSEVGSEDRGHSNLVAVNGAEIGTDEQLGKNPLCGLDTAGLVSVACLTASGGTVGAITTGAAEVARVTTGIDAAKTLSPIAAITTAASSGSGHPAPIVAPVPIPVPVPTIAATVGAEAVRGASGVAGTQTSPGTTIRTLPRTGTDTDPMAGPALAALALGVVLRRIGVRITKQ